MATKEKVLIICPGRGSYIKDSLNYLNPLTSPYREQVFLWDKQRQDQGLISITGLDQRAKFDPLIFTRGENAGPLIYTCSLFDFHNLKNSIEIVGILANSMGWYTALTLGQCLSQDKGLQLVSYMSSSMKDGLIGGQIVYSLVDENWNYIQDRERAVDALIEDSKRSSDGEIYRSIYLGGHLVLAGKTEALKSLLKKLPATGPYPFKLLGHGAFHTPLLADISHKAITSFPPHFFSPPQIPLIDGQGKIWWPFSTTSEELHQYTLDTQVTTTYDFTSSLTIALKEFAPTKIILLGPGNSLGGPIGHVLTQNKWQGIDSKSSFKTRQKENPFLISLGLKEQNHLLNVSKAGSSPSINRDGHSS